MNCPKCNYQNTDDVKICNACGCDLTVSQESQTQVRTSKLAIISFILGISSILFFVFTGLPAIITGIISNVKIKHSKGKLKGKPLAISGIIISILFMLVLFTFLMLWRVDAPPIPDDYTIADLQSASVEYAKSHELVRNLIYLFIDPRKDIEVLKEFNDFIENATGLKEQLSVPEDFIDKYTQSGKFEPLLSKEDYTVTNKVIEAIKDGKNSDSLNVLNKNAASIKQAWEKTQKARDIIHQLNGFPEIADLQKPNLPARLYILYPLIDLSKLYYTYANLQAEPNDIIKMANELIILDSVVRKLVVNARSLDAKLLYFEILGQSRDTANAIANKTETSQKTIELLAEHFKPLTKQQLSLKNPVIFEYLFLKNSIITFPYFSYMKYSSLLKANSTFRIYMNQCEDLLNVLHEDNGTQREKLSVWPTFYPFKEPVFPEKKKDITPSYYAPYNLYNPIGSQLVNLSSNFAYLSNDTQPFLKARRKDELLQIVLSKRLGKDLDFNTLNYGNEYIIDIENKKIFSPGPDGKEGTEDDISLPINPEVLGWTKVQN